VRVLATLFTDAAAAKDGVSLVQMVTVFVAFAIGWPLLTRLRRTLSERRRDRWSTAGAEADANASGTRPD
jgi:hypothetical protein